MNPWYKSAVIYELYVDKFAGNFQNLTKKLTYLSYLGINTIWVLPHYPSPLIDGGYDISDYYSLRPELGNLGDFENFIQIAHAHGIKVITDLVLNHTSSSHPWFIESQGSKVNPKRNWYMWSDVPDKFSKAYVHFPDQKPTGNWVYNPATQDYYYATFYKEQPDLNWDNPEVEEEMLKVADYWLNLGVDGFRLDAVSRLFKRENTYCFALPETHRVLQRLRAYIDTKYQNRILIAETGGWPDEARPFFGTGNECQLVLHFSLAVRMLAGIPYQEDSKFSQVLKLSGELPQDCLWSAFLTNHDSVDVFFLSDDGEKKWFLDIVDPKRQFTNPQQSSLGARLAEICGGDHQKILWATRQLLSLPAVPVIYYGNEIGMRNLSLPQKPADIRDYVRGDFDWAEAEKQKSEPNSLLNKIRFLIKNRPL